MLSFFLQTYRVLELTKDPSQALAPLVDEIRAERASVLARQTAVNDRLKDMEKRKVSKESTEWKQAEQEWKLLRDKLTFLPDPDKKKGKKLSQSERIDWTAYKDARLGDSGTALTHDERLHKVIAMFDADADFSVYPARSEERRVGK